MAEEYCKGEVRHDSRSTRSQFFNGHLTAKRQVHRRDSTLVHRFVERLWPHRGMSPDYQTKAYTLLLRRAKPALIPPMMSIRAVPTKCSTLLAPPQGHDTGRRLRVSLVLIGCRWLLPLVRVASHVLSRPITGAPLRPLQIETRQAGSAEKPNSVGGASKYIQTDA